MTFEICLSVSFQFPVDRYWLLATGYWQLATGNWLLATGNWEQEANPHQRSSYIQWRSLCNPPSSWPSGS